MSWLGIDPGLSGALALLQPDRLLVADVPTLTIQRNGKSRRDIDIHALLTIVRDCKAMGAERAFLEQVNAQPGNGAAHAFTYGKGYGVILCALAACGMPVEHVPAAVWKRVLKVPKDKDGARARASEIMPQHSEKWKRVKDDGRAEAALIAEYGRRLGL